MATAGKSLPPTLPLPGCQSARQNVQRRSYIVCGERKYDTSANPHSLLNPQAIFEVLSPSAEAFDLGDKFTRYQTIESLTDYVLVASERMTV